ncbi:hypothetical protein [Actinoplanes sp. NPDC026619]|uniref:hypothetical protein n=1 Tax=Actinoplanes sp. NPDC026619 TaxID=3155798 RepID=UPI0033E1C0CE
MSEGMDVVWHCGDERLLEQMQCLTEADATWAEGCLDIVAALDELLAWCEDTRAYNDRFHDNGWGSVNADFRYSLKCVGTGLKSLAGSSFAAIDAKLADDIAKDSSAVAELAVLVVDARRLLATDDALVAAWTDLVASCKRPETAIDSPYVRHDNFWAIVKLTGRMPADLSRTLISLLSGDPWAMRNALATLGDLKQNQDATETAQAFPLPGAATPPLSEPKDRLATAERLLRLPPRPVHHVIWLAFDNAGLTSSPVLTIGPVALYAGYALGPVLEDDDADRSMLPAELHKTWVPIQVPDGHDVVMARVDLGSGFCADPLSRARDLVRTMTAYAAARAGGSEWVEISGYIHVQDGRIVRSPTFGLDRIETTFRPDIDATAAGLSRYSGIIATGLPHALTKKRELPEALHWWHLADRQSGAPAVFVNVRIIEVLASLTVDMQWDKYLGRYWKVQWLRQAIREEANEALLGAMSTRFVVDGASTRQDELRSMAHGFDLGQMTWDVTAPARHLSEIQAILSAGTLQARQVRTLARRTANEAAIAKWVKSLEEQWTIRLSRLERVRNSIAHGGPVTPDSVSRVQRFSRQLSAWVVIGTLDAIMTGSPLKEANQGQMDAADTWRTQLPAATSLVEIL